MSFQLIYTSAERGLKSGSRGFTTVAMTEGMPAHCLQLCESMSGYVHVFELNSENYERNPVAWSHYRIKSGPNVYSVVSRVSAHPKDYTGRTNKIAHHLMLEHPRELQSYANGPGDLLGSPFFCKEWTGAPRFLPEGQKPPATSAKLDPQAGHWQAAGLPPDAAARIAQALGQGTNSPIVLLFEAGANDHRVGLIQDILDLLPPVKRWEIGFSTYYSMHPTGADIHIRACAKGTDAARRAARHPRAVVVDLTNGTIEGLQHLPEAGAALLSAATNGTMPDWAREPDPPAPQRKQEETEEPEESPQFKPLPPPRPDRPGAVRKRKPPPPPGKARPRSSAHTSKTPKELIGVLVGLLLLLSGGGLYLMTRDEGESGGSPGGNGEKISNPTATPKTTPQGHDVGKPDDESSAPEEARSSGSGDNSASNEGTDTDSEDVDPETVQEDDDVQETEDKAEDVDDDGDLQDKNVTDVDDTPQQPEQESPEHIATFKRLDFPVKIPKNGEDYYFFTRDGKKIPLKISLGAGNTPFLVKDENNSEKIKNNELKKADIPKAVIFVIKNRDESHVVYYQSDSVNVSGSYKDRSIVIENDTKDHLQSFMQDFDFHEKLTYAVEGRPTKVDFSNGDIQLYDAGVKVVQSFQALVKEKREKGRKDSVKDITSYKNELEEISNLKGNSNESVDEFINRKTKKLQDFIIQAFKHEEKNENNIAKYLGSDSSIKENKEKRKILYDSFEKKADRRVVEYNNPNKLPEYEKRISELMLETYEKTSLDKWVNACREALEAAKEDRLEEYDSATDAPPSFNFVVKVKNDVLIRINVSIE